jgi:hypothetical protein
VFASPRPLQHIAFMEHRGGNDHMRAHRSLDAVCLGHPLLSPLMTCRHWQQTDAVLDIRQLWKRLTEQMRD